MSNIPLSAKCPNCGSNAVIRAAVPESDGEPVLVCTACGRKDPPLDFVDKAVALDEAAKLLQDAFRDIPGFKKK